MTLLIEPEIGVPYAPNEPYMDLKIRAEAACNTVQELSAHGLEVKPDKEDQDIASKLSMAYAEDPEKTSKKVTNKRAATLTPASLVLTSNILQEFGQSVANSAMQVRHMVTNKLILETDNPDPRVRIRALELLGKISDVGLFSDKTEVTVTHKTTDELRESLRAKLSKLINPEEVEDAVVLDGEPVDVDKELGLKDV
tara:strand:+ start:707 stop:1297 length:591 start_codon:yes stop_codon:yes gene_type:complete